MRGLLDAGVRPLLAQERVRAEELLEPGPAQGAHRPTGVLSQGVTVEEVPLVEEFSPGELFVQIRVARGPELLPQAAQPLPLRPARPVQQLTARAHHARGVLVQVPSGCGA
ncbi:hypothetical protein ACWDYF_35810 [Streptomyces sp. NPDC003284]